MADGAGGGGCQPGADIVAKQARASRMAWAHGQWVDSAHAIEQPRHRPGAEHRDVVDAVPTGQRQADHGQRLRTAVRCRNRQPDVLVDEVGDAQALGQQPRNRQAAAGQQRVLVEGRGHTREIVRCFHRADALRLWVPAVLDTRIVPGQRALVVEAARFAQPRGGGSGFI